MRVIGARQTPVLALNESPSEKEGKSHSGAEVGRLM